MVSYCPRPMFMNAVLSLRIMEACSIGGELVDVGGLLQRMLIKEEGGWRLYRRGAVQGMQV